MRNALVISFVLYLASYAPLCETLTRAAGFPVAFAEQQGQASEWFLPEQLDNLCAPIALYPDPLLAQVLVAATFPSQIDEASRFLRAGADPKAIDDQPWDVSVKAVAHYPTVLYRMADNLDWTTSLGQAYVNQSTDVMTSVQRLRAQARAAGTLVTTSHMEVVADAGYIRIWPAQPRFIYVPVYDPAFVFLYRPGFRPGIAMSFGVGFAIGAWLNYDCDWGRHRIYYHGWTHGSGWVHRSRPHVRLTTIYVSNHYTNITINRKVVNRRVNYHNLNRYNTVHRHVTYDNIRVKRPDYGSRGARSTIGRSREVHNKIIRRNIDLNDPRIQANRGRVTRRPVTRPGIRRETPSTPQRRQPTVQRQRPRTAEPQRRQPTVQRQRPRTAEPQRRQPTVQRQVERREHSVFRGPRTVIEPQAASRRGQISRQRATRPAPSPARRGSGMQRPSGGRRR